MLKRRRFIQSTSLQDRLASFARQIEDEAPKCPPGPDREKLLKKAHQAETAARLDGWVGASDGQKPHSEGWPAERRQP
jgi:hypothetical protein